MADSPAVDPSAFTAEVIDMVRARMAEEGVSINRLAGLLGVHQQTLNRQLSGVGTLSIGQWEAITQVLHLHLEELLEAARRLH